jgi:hypothetical protein
MRIKPLHMRRLLMPAVILAAFLAASGVHLSGAAPLRSYLATTVPSPDCDGNHSDDGAGADECPDR